MKRLAWLLAFLLWAFASAPANGQEPPTLDRVEELTRLGRAEEARETLTAWWGSQAPKASRRDVQRGLWLRGRLTVDPTQADLDFRRLVIEYPGGPYSDQALFRLAQSAWAAGDSVAAVAHTERLAVEYPGSPVRREADAWLATAGPLPPRRGAEPTPAATDAPSPEGTFTVQLGAFSSRSRAESLLARVADAGVEGRLATVPGSDLIRVRVGVFDSAEGADAILKRLRDLGLTAALARDAHREQRVR